MTSTTFHRFRDLTNYSIEASCESVGRIDDLYVDASTWAVRELLIDVGGRRSTRKTINPGLVTGVDSTRRVLTVSLTKEQVTHASGVNLQRPLSRQHESQALNRARYPHYWESTSGGTDGLCPPIVMSGLGYRGTSPGYLVEMHERARAAEASAYQQQLHDDMHLRSLKALLNTSIHAIDGEIGSLRDFQYETDPWLIRHLIVATGHWWDRHAVLVDVRWVLAQRGRTSGLWVNRTRSFLQALPVTEAA